MNNSTQIASHLLRSRIGKLCVAIIGTSPNEMIEKATEVLKESNFLEFRLDYLAKPLAALPALKHFLAENSAATVIATCRLKDNGGRFDGSKTAELEILVKAAAAGFHLVDIELESIEKLPKNTMSQLREAGAAVIISYHDFHATKELDAVYGRMKPFHPDFYKIVPTARSLSDNLTLMKFLERVEDESNSSVVGICMGEPGIISRVLGLRAGSAFTFAAASVGEETAPGQIAARTLIETYRVDQVDAATKIYGVAGNPIKSSLSPLMMNTAFRRETVNAVYLGLQTSKAEDLVQAGARGADPGDEHHDAAEAGRDAAAGADRCAVCEDWRGEYDSACAGWEVLRIQHGCCGDRGSAGTAAVVEGREGVGTGRWWCRAGGGVWLCGQGCGGFHPESHSGDGAEVGEAVGCEGDQA